MFNALSAVLIFVIGYFFFRSLIGDKDEYRAKMQDAKDKAQKRAEDRAKEKARVAGETMHQCAVCEAYILASGTTSCGREDCPY
jgi:ABC-type nickel/cobalt efflux system permease component RcnA